MPTLCLIFIVGILAGIVSGMIGGGSGLVLVPVQLLLGIDPVIATTTTHFGFIGVSLGSLARFNKERAIRTKYIIPVIFLTSGKLSYELSYFRAKQVLLQELQCSNLPEILSYDNLFGSHSFSLNCNNKIFEFILEKKWFSDWRIVKEELG